MRQVSTSGSSGISSLGVFGHVGAMEATKTEMDDSGRDLSWVVDRPVDGGWQSVQIFSG